MILIIDECVKLYKANVMNYKHTQIYMLYTRRVTPRLHLLSTLSFLYRLKMGSMLSCSAVYTQLQKDQMCRPQKR